MTTSQVTPYALTRDEGPAYWTVGVLARMKVTGAETDGALALVDEWCPPGYETPLHVHRFEDETYYILEGRVTIFCGDARIEAEAGACVFGPRNVPHGFRIEGAQPGRLLIVANPAGFENFLQELGERVATGDELPTTPLDIARVQAVASDFGIEILGPLPA